MPDSPKPPAPRFAPLDAPSAARRFAPLDAPSAAPLRALDVAAVRAELERLGAVRRPVAPADVGLMLAETAAGPFSREGWLFELKHDGFRLVAARHGGPPELYFRRGSQATTTFPEVAAGLAALPPPDALVLDGELVVLDGEGRPDLPRLQRRFQLHRAADIARAAVETPATLFVFDLVAWDGLDLRPLPLAARKALLARLVPPGEGALRFSAHVDREGEAFFAEVERLGLEGIMAKRADSPYRAGRSSSWQKIKSHRDGGDFVIVGYTRPRGARVGLGALHLGDHRGGRLVYAGRVGTGFDAALLSSLRARLEPLGRKTPPCEGAPATGREHTWVEPRLACEVTYVRRTEDGRLWHPVFVRLRDDKPPEECVAEEPPAARDRRGARREESLADPRRSVERSETERPRVTEEPPALGRPRVTVTHPEKLYFPADGYTKGDLVEHYRRVAPWLLPVLRDRPLVVTRFPDGIDGKSFYQHDAPSFLPSWFRTHRLLSSGHAWGFGGARKGDARREIDYLVVDDERSLLYLANLGAIPIHVFASRTASLESPDWSVLDLDPKGAPTAWVVEIARRLHALCDEIELPVHPKTSGQSGLHLLIPLGAAYSYEQARALAELLARVVTAERPDIATVARPIAGRGGRVYVDYLQNSLGRTIVAPLSVRPRPGAPVSTPLAWSEVDDRLDPARFTLRTVPERLARGPAPPDLLGPAPDLARALALLGERMARPARR